MSTYIPPCVHSKELREQLRAGCGPTAAPSRAHRDDTPEAGDADRQAGGLSSAADRRAALVSELRAWLEKVTSGHPPKMYCAFSGHRSPVRRLSVISVVVARRSSSSVFVRRRRRRRSSIVVLGRSGSLSRRPSSVVLSPGVHRPSSVFPRRRSSSSVVRRLSPVVASCCRSPRSSVVVVVYAHRCSSSLVGRRSSASVVVAGRRAPSIVLERRPRLYHLWAHATLANPTFTRFWAEIG